MHNIARDGINAWHNGAIPGGASYAVFNQVSGNGFVVCVNQLTPLNGELMDFIMSFQFELGERLAFAAGL